jgi:hypothetical protein
MENADAVEVDMGLQTAGAIKFCFRKPVRAEVRTRKRVDPALLAETPVKSRCVCRKPKPGRSDDEVRRGWRVI